MKLLVIVGHTRNAQGATSYKGVSEYVWNSQVAKHMKDYADTMPQIDVLVDFRDNGGVAGAARRGKAWGAEASIELHFNAFHRPAFGCECLILRGDVESAKHADLLTDKFSAHYGIKQRRVTEILPSSFEGDGVYEVSSGANGYGNLNAVKSAGIPIRLLFEPAFMNTENADSVKIHDDQQNYARLLVNYFAGIDEEINQYKIHSEAERQKEFIFDTWAALNDAWKTKAIELLMDDEEIKQKEILAEAQRQKEVIFDTWTALNELWRTDASFSRPIAHDLIIGDLAQKMESWPTLYDMSAPPVKDEPVERMPWLRLARSELGQCRIPGPQHNQEIVKFWSAVTAINIADDDTAWCAAFAWWILIHSGCKVPNDRPATARSFQTYGLNLGNNYRYGALAVFWRGTRNGWQGHVGFAIGEDATRIKVLGGNQSGCVTEAWYPKERLLGYRMPVLK